MSHVVIPGGGIGGIPMAFEKYFLRKIRKGIGEPGYEKKMLRLAGLSRLKL